MSQTRPPYPPITADVGGPVLVVGATGTVGRSVVSQLVDAGVAVRAVTRTPNAAGLPDESFQAMLHAWAGLHGFTSLEANGHLDWITPEARDALFLTQLQLIAMATGLPTG